MAALPAARGLPGLRVLALTTLQQAGLTTIRFGLPILAPFWRDAFHLSLSQVGLLLGAFDLGSLLLFIPIGLLTDRWGERRVLLAGALFTGLAAALVTQARSLASLVLLILIAGLGYGSGQTAGVKAVAAAFGAGARGMAMGIRQSGLPIGGLIAALLMPPLSAALGWRPALAAAALVCALPGVLCWIGLRGPARGGGRAAAPRGSGGPVSAQLRQIVRNLGVRRITEAAMLLVFAQMCYQGYLALYLVDRFRWSNHAATTLLVAVHLGGILGRLAWGAVSDRRYGGRRVPALAWCVAGGTVFPLALILLPPAWARPLPAAAVAFAGGMLLLGWNGLYSTLVAESTSRDAATAMGMSMTGLYSTSMVAPLLFGWLVDRSSYAAGWAALVLVMAAALLVSTRIPEPGAPAQSRCGPRGSPGGPHGSPCGPRGGRAA